MGGDDALSSVNERDCDFSSIVDEQATRLTRRAVSINNCRAMRTLPWLLLLAACAIPVAGLDSSQIGYVDCSSSKEHLPIPVYSNRCTSIPAARLDCGEKVTVLGREGPWLRIASTDGSQRYIGAASISQRRDRFVAVDLPAPSGQYSPDCSVPRPKTGKVPARAIFSPSPEYTKKALKARIEGSVTLALTVGTDGFAHDVKVVVGLGYGLDERAVEAVQLWKFEPALLEGSPIESKMAVEVNFRSSK
jgi:TonB family protein